ncbi:MAG: VWA domain-containing protein [Acidobacteriota bacterium]|jgi:VWFA-related protein
MKNAEVSPFVVALAVVSSALFSSGAGAQQQQQQQQQQGNPPAGQDLVEQEMRPQFGAAVDRVLVDVAVVDDDGNFVPDLTADDFTILEEGEPVELSFFALERFRETLPVRVDEDGSEHDNSMAPSLQEAPLLPRYMVLFIDGFNTSPPDWDNVRYALNEYLDEFIQPNDRILLATLTPRRRLMVAPEFTRDIESLRRSINEIVTNPTVKERERQQKQDMLRALYEDTNLAVITDDPQDVFTSEANQLRQGASMAEVFAGQRKDEILYTLEAMTSLAAHLNRTFDVPGPKTMIMVSAGIAQNPGAPYFYILDARLDQLAARARTEATTAAEHPVAFRSRYSTTIEEYILRTIGNLNRLNYTLYTIGARGTSIGAFADTTDQYRSNLTPGISTVAYQSEEEGLRMLSNGTGGLPFVNSANFRGAFEQIDRDTAFRYVLGYNPPPRADNADPEKFYRIQVRVDRDDVTVRARHGYVDGTTG